MLYEIGDKVLDEWVITRTIGEGSYGKVVEIERNEFGLSMKSALKIISIPGNNSEIRAVMGEGIDNKSITSYFYGFVEEIIKEIAIMSELKGHTNIVTYEDHRVIPHQQYKYCNCQQHRACNRKVERTGSDYGNSEWNDLYL